MNKETMAAILPGEKNKEIDNKSKFDLPSGFIWFHLGLTFPVVIILVQ